MFYKIVKGNTIVDATQVLSYVRQNLINKVIIACSPEIANGIVSSDGSVIWHLEGQPQFLEGSFESVKVVEITESEYNTIIEVLGNGEEAENAEDNEAIRAPLSNTEVLEKIESLQNQVDTLTAKNTQLQEELKALRGKNG